MTDEFESFVIMTFPDSEFNELKKTKFPNVAVYFDTNPEWYDEGGSLAAYYKPAFDNPYIESGSYVELGGKFKGIKIYVSGSAEISRTDQKHGINGHYGTAEYEFLLEYYDNDVEIENYEDSNRVYDIISNMGYDFAGLADYGYNIDDTADESTLSDEEKYIRVCAFILEELSNLDNYGIPEIRELLEECTDRSNAYIDAMDDWAEALSDEINSANEEFYD